MASPESRSLPEGEQKWQQQAKLAHELVRRDGRDASLIMIVDDFRTKLDETRKEFEERANDHSMDVVITTYQTGEDAVGFFTAFKRVDQEGRPVQVAVVLDHDLRGMSQPQTAYPTGTEVASEMLELCEEHGWETPLFYSNSLIDHNNDRFNATFADHVTPGLHAEYGCMAELKRRKSGKQIES